MLSALYHGYPVFPPPNAEGKAHPTQLLYKPFTEVLCIEAKKDIGSRWFGEYTSTIANARRHDERFSGVHAFGHGSHITTGRYRPGGRSDRIDFIWCSVFSGELIKWKVVAARALADRSDDWAKIEG
jgi:hypothetical protein